MSDFKYIGKRVPRADAYVKVTGRAEFVGDIELPRMLVGKIVRSPYAHARIVSIDTSEAEKVPGVAAVLTSADCPNTLHGQGMNDEPLIARNEVLYVGESVVGVAAENDTIAELAASLIKIEYEELPALFDPVEAMKPDCPVILHPDVANYVRMIPADPIELATRNCCHHSRVVHGDAAKGFAEADQIFEGTYECPMVNQVYMEPHASIGQWNYDGTVDVWSNNQSLWSARVELSYALGIEDARIRFRIPYVGGAFGGKFDLFSEAVAVMLSKKADGRPVKIVYSREENFIATSERHPAIINIKTGVKNDGTIVAQEWHNVYDGGPYSRIGWFAVRQTIFFPAGCYHIPNFFYEVFGAYTNNPVSGAFRGFGFSQVTFAQESHMDEIARALHMDPRELRKKNILKEGDENVLNELIPDYGGCECVDKATGGIGWDTPLERENGDWRRGRGMTFGCKYSSLPSASSVFLKIYNNETFEVRQSYGEQGQGIHTVVMQIVAEYFGVDPSKVKILHNDTSRTPWDHHSGSSRATFCVGNALLLACKDAKDQLLYLAGKKMGVAPEELDTVNCEIFVKNDPEKRIRIKDVFQPHWLGGPFVPEIGEILGKATWSIPNSKPDRDMQCPDDGIRRLTCYYIQGSQAAEVEVNIRTGQVRLLKFAAAHDVGQAINPTTCEGQIHGALSGGIGPALTEELYLDHGKILNPSFHDYKAPLAPDLPSNDNIKTFLVEHTQKDGPYGARGGLGEGTITQTSAAIANAIYDAIGIRFYRIPISPEVVLRALQEQKKCNQK